MQAFLKFFINNDFQLIDYIVIEKFDKEWSESRDVMNRQKLANIHLQASIHTSCIVSSELSQKSESEVKYFKLTNMRMPNPDFDIKIYRYIINANKTGYGNLNTYSEFKEVFEYCLDDMGIEKYNISRCDFSIDNYKDDFNQLFKLNKCIILMFSLMYSMDNRYQSIDPLMLDTLTIRVQNARMECEYYNKEIESSGRDKARNRLELRSKSIAEGKDIPILIGEWIKKLDNIIKFYDKLQYVSNKQLAKRWELERGIKVKSLTEFLRKYEEIIFSRKQLIAFFELIGVPNAPKRADNFKYANDIEYFTKGDLMFYIDIVKKSLREYLV